MPQIYDTDLNQQILETSVMKLIEIDNDPDPPLLKHILILNLLKTAGVSMDLLFGVNRRDNDDRRNEAKYRKLNNGTAVVTRDPDDSLPQIDVSSLINHLTQGLPLIQKCPPSQRPS